MYCVSRHWFYFERAGPRLKWQGVRETFREWSSSFSYCTSLVHNSTSSRGAHLAAERSASLPIHALAQRYLPARATRCKHPLMQTTRAKWRYLRPYLLALQTCGALLVTIRNIMSSTHRSRRLYHVIYLVFIGCYYWLLDKVNGLATVIKPNSDSQRQL